MGCGQTKNLLYYLPVIKMIYTCDNCHFLFKRVSQPEQCPDCGKYAIRVATEREQQEYHERLEKMQDK